MMKIGDCEISRLHLRGVSTGIVIGSALATNEDLASLLAGFREIYGNDLPAAYLSPAGWQTFDAVAATKQYGEPVVKQFGFEPKDMLDATTIKSRKGR